MSPGLFTFSQTANDIRSAGLARWNVSSPAFTGKAHLEGLAGLSDQLL